MYLLINTLISYLIGSINGAIVVTNILQLKDLRTEGSQNPGATNMYRVHGKIPAILVLTIDFSKAILAINLTGHQDLIFITAAVCLGHIFPIYHKFKGGKGVAVTAGIITGISWQLALITITAWLLTLKITKISSVAATGATIICLLMYFTPMAKTIEFQALIIPAIAVIASHKENYKRLIAGSEHQAR